MQSCADARRRIIRAIKRVIPKERDLELTPEQLAALREEMDFVLGSLASIVGARVRRDEENKRQVRN